MKQKTVLLASLGILMGSLSMSCNSPAKKVENAEEKVLEANKDLKQANQEYVTEMENYRKETAIKVAANEKTIADFNIRIASEKKADRVDYEKKVWLLPCLHKPVSPKNQPKSVWHISRDGFIE